MSKGPTKSKSRPILIWLACLLVPVLLVAGFLLLRGSPQHPGQPPSPDTTAPESPAETAATVPTTEDPTASQATKPTEPPEQPAILAGLLEAEGITFEHLAESGCTQLICVTAQDTSATIRFFYCQDALWEELPHLNSSGHVGASGVSVEKQEGDGATPSGLYPVRDAFYIDQPPQTELNMFEITQDTYWVDDPDSDFYNQKVEGTESKDWSSAEHMIDYPVYRCGFTVGYNEECQYGAGSAIFFHIGDHPTAGCIATNESMVRSYLALLDKAQNPCILITNG